MDLALENRIDTDLEKLTLISDAPVGDDLLDPVLEEIVAAEDKRDARFWVERTAGHAEHIREVAFGTASTGPAFSNAATTASYGYSSRAAIR